MKQTGHKITIVLLAVVFAKHIYKSLVKFH